VVTALGHRFTAAACLAPPFYAISDKPMSNEGWSKRYVTPH
jgi:hypothetical protein